MSTVLIAPALEAKRFDGTLASATRYVLKGISVSTVVDGDGATVRQAATIARDRLKDFIAGKGDYEMTTRLVKRGVLPGTLALDAVVADTLGELATWKIERAFGGGQ